MLNSFVNQESHQASNQEGSLVLIGRMINELVVPRPETIDLLMMVRMTDGLGVLRLRMNVLMMVA